MSQLLPFQKSVLFLFFVILGLPNFLSANNHDLSFAQNALAGLLNSINESANEVGLDVPYFKNMEHLNIQNFNEMPVPCGGASGEIGGKAFGDFNYDGLDNQISGLPDIIVNIYSCDMSGANQLVQTTTTDVNGQYSFTGLSDGTRYQLEFLVPAHLPAYQEAFLGDNLGAIQYVTSPSCDANVGFTHPQDYCGHSNPPLVATCFINGDPLAVGAEAAGEDVLVGFNWDDSGTTPLPDHLAVAEELGAVYGLGYHRATKKLYTSAFLKRHVGLGPLGIGGIYEIDMTNPNNPIIKEFLDVESIGIDVGDIPSNAARGLPTVLDDPSNDPDAYSKIGREGIGALSVSEDGKIWFTNLFDKKLYSIVIDSDSNPNTAPTAGDVESFTLPDAMCSNGEFRPFAVEVFRDEIYVGGVCDAFSSQSRSDLSTIIYEKSGTSFTEIANFSLDFEKGWASNADTCENYSGWFAWTDNIPPICATGFYIQPQPVLSEFEFDIDGSIIAGYMDRTGHQLGYKNWPTVGTSPIISNVSGGDLLRIDNNNGVYQLENNGTAGDLTSGGTGNLQGPGGGEFYFEDIFAGPSDNIPGPPHAETSQGALAFYRGSGDVLTTAIDPYSTLFNSGGVNWLNNTTGTVQNPGYVLYRSSTSSISTFAKANGLGSLTILCADDPPLQIGKYIWEDSDSDGIQDACETGLASVNVTLYDENGNILQTTSTDGNGYYSFTDLNPNTLYYIVAGTGGQFNTMTNELNGSFFLTFNDIGDGTDPDKTDSDGQLAGTQGNSAFVGMPFIQITTGDYGFVINSSDFGFSTINVNPVAGIGGFVWNDPNQNGIQDGGETGIEGVTVTLFDSGDNDLGSTTSDASGNYFFSNVSAGNYYLDFDETTNTAGITNYLTSPQNQVGNDNLDSDIDPNTGQTATFAFDPADGNTDNVDAGFYLNEGSIGGFVWNDENENGIQDGGEPGIEGVTVILTENGSGNQIQTVFSDSNGNFTFTGVPPGTYIIMYDPDTNSDGIPNLEGSPQNQGGDDTLDSDPDPITHETDPIVFDPTGGDLNDTDAGFFEPSGSIGGFVWDDINENGIQDGGELGIEGVTVHLLNSSTGANIQTTMTNASGFYSFSNVELGNYVLEFDQSTNTAGIPNLVGSPQNQGGDDSLDSDPNPSNGQTDPISYDPANGNLTAEDAGFYEPTNDISGFVWMDSNEDGLQNGVEPGIEGVTVILINDNTSIAEQTTTSGADGSYSFSDVSLGDYLIMFDVSTNAMGIADYQGTFMDVGADDSIDSDADPNSGETNVFSFDPTNGISNVSAGYFIPTEMLGGFVWLDEDNDGIQDNNESGVGGVTVMLYDENDNPIDATLSNPDGSYGFDNVTQGNYYIVFDFSTTGNNNYNFTLQDQGIDDTVDSDPNPVNGQTITFGFDPADGGDNTWSAGLTLPFAEISGIAFHDCNMNGIQDVDEDPISDIPVMLFENGGLIDSEITLGNGTYSFSNVPAGDYSVMFGLPAAFPDYGYTLQNQGGDDSVDSDVDQNTGFTMTISVAGGQDISNVDAGYFGDEFPIFINPPADMNLPCSDPTVIDPPDVTVIDNDDNDLDIVFDEQTITGGGTCMGGLTIIRTWTATDGCGNSTTHTQTITSVDELPPVIVGIPDITVECDSLPTTDDVKAIDDCDTDVDLTYTDSLIMDGECMMLILRKWIATDDCGNMTMNLQKITTVDMTHPMITLKHPLLEDLQWGGSLWMECENMTEFVLEDAMVMDNCDDDPMLMLMISSLEGDCETDGFFEKITYVWLAEDACGNTSTVAIVVYVTDEIAPVANNIPADVTVNCDEIPNPEDPDFTDNCDDDLTETFDESLVGDTCSDYQIIRIWTAEDDCDNLTEIQQTIHVTVDETEFVNPPDDLTVDCPDIPEPADVTAENDCFDVEIEFNEDLVGDTCMDYQIIRVWTATDDCGNSISHTQTINVDVDELELMNVPADITVECTEIPDPDDVTAENDCFEVEIDFFELTIEGGCEDKVVRTWTATDDCGNMTTHVQTITTEDTTPPEIELTHPMLAGIMDGDTLVFECDSLINFGANDAVAIDECSDATIDFMEMPTVGVCDEDGFIVRMDCCWKAEDECGNQSQFCITVDIVDTTPPELIGVPADLTIDLSLGETVPDAPTVTAEDNCDTDSDVDFFENQVPGSNNCGFTLTRTWTSEDICGNQITENQVITALDNCDCPNDLVTNFSVTNAECGLENGSIKLNLTGNYDLSLIPNLGNPNPDGFTSLPFGMYELTVSDPMFPDCEEFLFFNILQVGCLDTMGVVISEPLEVCIDQSLIDYSGTITSASILNDGNPLTVQATGIDDYCVDLNPAANYLGTSPDIICLEMCFNGSPIQCDTTYLIVTVEEKQDDCQLTLEAEMKDPDCEDSGGMIEVTVSGNSGNLTYEWNPNVSSSNIATNLQSGIYNLTITDESDDCQIDTFFTLASPNPVSLELFDLIITAPTCPGESGHIHSNTGLAYQVWVTNGGQVGMTPQNALNPGSYTVIHSNGICSDSLIIEFLPIPDWDVTYSSTDETCVGNDGTITISAAGANGDYTYLWAPGVSDSETATGLSAGVLYSVTIEDSEGCQFFLNDLSIQEDCTIIPCTLNLITENVAHDTCSQSSGEIHLSTSGAQGSVIYSWTPAVSVSDLATGLPVGTYQIMAIDSAGCLDSLSVDIQSVPPDWNADFTSTNETCVGNDGMIEIFFSGNPPNATYNWWPVVSDSSKAENLPSDEYSVTITNDAGCSEILNIEIENEGQTWSASETHTDETCLGNDGTIQIQITDDPGTLTYEWTPDVSSTNSATGLSAGNYEINILDSNNCSDTINVEILPAQTPNWDATVNSTNESCAQNDGSIELIVTGGSGDLIYEWTPNVSDSSSAHGLAADTLYSVIITDENGCVFELNDLSIDFDCNPNIITETIQKSIICGDSTAQLCVSMSELPGDFASLLVIQQPDDGALTFENDTCMIYEGNNDFEGLDSVGMLLCDDLGFCDTTWFAVQVDTCITTVPCAGFIDEPTIFTSTGDCNLDAEICLEYPLDSMLDLTIYDNGDLYFDDIIGCLNDTVLSYSYFAVPGMGNDGPYELISWTVNGSTHSAPFNSIQELVDWMNTWDGAATWTADTTTLSIFGGNPSSSYSSLMIEQTNSGAQANLDLNTKLSPNGSQIYLPVGSHEIVFIDENTGCSDTLTVEVICITTELICDTVSINDPVINCADLSELPGSLISNELICVDCDNSDVNLVNECLRYEGFSVGQDSAGIVLCDHLGFCDTTWFKIIIEDQGPLPLAVIDADTVQSGVPTILHVLDNDELFGDMVRQEITEKATYGEANTNGDGTITYMSEYDFCGLDALAYSICNHIGCDTATVNIFVRCDIPEPMNGFSPNDDGVNDGFMIKSLEQYAENELIIFNRWGEIVYQKKNYENGEWKGTYENLDLPDGTYFYLLKYGSGGKMTGWVQIER